MISDTELVSATLRDPQAYAGLVERYQAPLRRYIIRLGCSNTEDIEDVLQDIFIKVYVNLNEYNAGLKFSSWVYRIAHNETITFFRKRKVRPSTVHTEEELRAFEMIADESDFTKDIDEKINAKALMDALALLDSSYRDILVLAYLEQKSYEEISDILRIPMGTVATHISRGKKKMKEILTSKDI